MEIKQDCLEARRECSVSWTNDCLSYGSAHSVCKSCLSLKILVLNKTLFNLKEPAFSKSLNPIQAQKNA